MYDIYEVEQYQRCGLPPKNAPIVAPELVSLRVDFQRNIYSTDQRLVVSHEDCGYTHAQHRLEWKILKQTRKLTAPSSEINCVRTTGL